MRQAPLILALMWLISARAAETAAPAAAQGVTAGAPSGVDPKVMQCLYGRGKPAPTPPPVPGTPKPTTGCGINRNITSRPVANPLADLPMQCLDGQMDEARKALANQIGNCSVKSEKSLESTQFQFGCKMVTKRDYCLNASTALAKIANKKGMTYSEFVKQAATQMDWYKSDGRDTDCKKKHVTIGNGQTEFTAYYNPSGVDVSPVQTSDYHYPIYPAPPGLTHIEKGGSDDPKKGCGRDPNSGTLLSWCINNGNGTYSPVPARIDADKAYGGKAIAYFKSLYEVSTVMLEGSAQVTFHNPDGSTQQAVLNNDGQNGRPNKMLDSVLNCETKTVPDSTRRAYYDTHQDEVYTDTVVYNPSMPFFVKGNDFMGVDNIPITPHASMATDPEVIPTGTTALFNVPSGDPTKCGGTKSTVALAQDVGGKIKGAHNDRYTGVGPDAQHKAGTLDDPGLVFMAVPKDAGTPIPGCTLDTGPGA